MPRPTNARTKADFLVTIDAIPNYAEYWSTLTGLEDSAGEGASYSDGVRRNLLKLPGVREVAPITMTKIYDHVADLAFMRWWDTWCEGRQAPIIVTAQPVFYCDNQPEPDGNPYQLVGCRPTGVKPFEVDKTSQDVAMFEARFTVDRIIYP